MKHKASIIFFSLLVISVIFFIFRNWFYRGILSGFDIPFLYPERLQEFKWDRYAWSGIGNNGLGGSILSQLNIDTYLQWGTLLLVFILHLPWNLTLRILFFWPFLTIGFISSFLMVRKILNDKVSSLIGALIYITNTYILMIVGGGQMGIALAYAICPLVIWSFLSRKTIFLTLSLSLLMLFDIRISFLVFGVIILLLIFSGLNNKFLFFKVFLISLFISLGLNSFWLVPGFFSSSLSLPEGYGSPGWLNFLSVATFSNSLSVLHPNWPDNVFGKTYFMRPEFLVIPIIAYCSLLFINWLTSLRAKKFVLFFALIGLLGAFLAKGANPPFGEIYAWLFLHFPLFSVFRDATKFYLLIILSYSIIIPFSLKFASDFFSKENKKIAFLIPLLFIFYWLILLTPLWNGQVKGTFSSILVPSEYYQFNKVIASDSDFNRVLAVPWSNRFIPSTEKHPLISASSVFKTTDIPKILELISKSEGLSLLENLGVKYVVIPDDFSQEIFLTDRKYDSKIRDQVKNSLDNIPSLQKNTAFSNLSVYNKKSYKELFYSLPPWYVGVSFKKISPVSYTVFVKDSNRPLKLIFSEKYDPNWQLWDGEKIIKSTKTEMGFNSFYLDSNITSQVYLFYRVQKFVDLFSLKFLQSEQTKKDFDILNNPNIWWSKEWKKIRNPFDGKEIKFSRYGGGELKFGFTNSSKITFQVSSSNDEPGEGIDIDLDGKTYSLATPKINSKELTISIDPNTKDKVHEVRVRHFCSGSYSPCDLVLQSIILDKKALIKTSTSIPAKTIAILGDSITVGFGDKNFSYLFSDKLGYQLHNAGVFGSSVSEVANFDNATKRYIADVVSFKPDVTIVFLGTNDLAHKVPMETFQLDYLNLLRGIKSGSPKTTIIAVGLLRRKDFELESVLKFSNVIRVSAESLNIDYIDPYDWLESGDLMDEVHPSLQSQNKLTEKFYQAVLQVLQNRH